MIDQYTTDRMTQAILLAQRIHGKHVDKAGFPYMGHVLRVGIRLLPDVDAATVGVLHDALEDCPGDDRLPLAAEIINLFGWHVATACMVLTRRGEPYGVYIERLLAPINKLALRVKLEDLADNTRIERLCALTAKGIDIAPLVRRYSRAIVTLNRLKHQAPAEDDHVG